MSDEKNSEELENNSTKKRRGAPEPFLFTKGCKGGPGRPKGSRNSVTIALEEMLNAGSDSLMAKTMELAREGDIVALKFCLERLIAPAKDRPINFKLDKLATPKDVLDGLATLSMDLAEGNITPSEAHAASNVLGQFQKAHELVEIDQRMSALEAAMKKAGI